MADRDAALIAAPAEALTLTVTGPEGEAHAGRTRPACAAIPGSPVVRTAWPDRHPLP